ncbi:hypothetical protein GOBAR_AA25024 [Gossypium barbadense]|uniref:Glutamine amidotransferase type-2 domain-containing protein n=1 Tax=Gossypium barbadense TaxID=3634 RepID=A0A2P5WX19_GOSBA|nr:hypothetical protein GOBAR_AA25024 [Gossypium barbadense]
MEGFKGQVMRLTNWKVAKATFPRQFEEAMFEMRSLSESDEAWLRDKDPRTWSRAHFSIRCQSDLLLNNNSEYFNKPFVVGYRFGSIGVAHNENLVNYRALRAMLEDNSSIFNTSSDTKVILHLITISKARPFFLRIVEACEKLEGAYLMVFLIEDKLVTVSVYESRHAFGEILAIEAPVDCDVMIAVPDSGVEAE